ncbi:MAG: hypothetical protein ACJA0H_002380 [Francisellaceae bacterium]|jgi:hypothetical protein
MKKVAAVLLIAVLSLGTMSAFASNSFVSYTQIQQSSLYGHTSSMGMRA